MEDPVPVKVEAGDWVEEDVTTVPGGAGAGLLVAVEGVGAGAGAGAGVGEKVTFVGEGILPSGVLGGEGLRAGDAALPALPVLLVGLGGDLGCRTLDQGLAPNLV